MRAIALVSGGLDSILAARIIKEQGINVLALHFKIPFCPHKAAAQGEDALASFVRKNLGEELRRVEVGVDFLELLLKPKHGFGANMNPCIDCKIFMLKKAKELMQAWDAQFVVTGEVLGQRPMSQHRKALEIIERESGLQGLLLRPLCAKVLAETMPEREGWLRRQNLFEFSGRTRRPQIALASKLGIDTYPNPAGGCLLTDPQFANRLRDLINHHDLNLQNIALLKIGRHFRLAKRAKLIVGRNEGENKELEQNASKGDYLFMPDENTAGPTCLGRGEFDAGMVKLSSGIACYYCDLNGSRNAKIIYNRNGQHCFVIAEPVTEDDLMALRV